MARTITAQDFEPLYRAVAPELFGYLRRRGVQDAEDVVAEVFTTAWRRRSDLPAPMLRRAWLFGTARRLLLADGRRRQQHEEAATYLVESRATTENPSTEAIVAEALARLSPGDRELILLTEWESLTPAEIAVALGIRPGTVRVRLHRARQALAADPAMRRLVEGSLSPAPG